MTSLAGERTNFSFRKAGGIRSEFQFRYPHLTFAIFATVPIKMLRRLLLANDCRARQQDTKEKTKIFAEKLNWSQRKFTEII